MMSRSDSPDPFRPIKTLVVRIRSGDDGSLYGTGQGIAFSGDDKNWDDPEHETALNKLATWLLLTME